MHKLTLLGCCVLSAASCKKSDDPPNRDPVAPITAMRANLRNAVLIALVADEGGQQASRVDLPGVRKDGLPLCQDLTVEELGEVDGQGAFVNDCENPEPLSFCQDISPDKLATGRVECTERPWMAGDLIAVDHNGGAFSVLPTLPSWNQVTQVQQSEGALLVTLRLPIKLLRSDQTTGYCHVLYYAIDTQSDSIVPYCYEYDYGDTFCFGPGQRTEWNGWDVNTTGGLEVPVSGEACTYTETLEQFETGPEVCATRQPCPGEMYTATRYIHVTPNALFQAYTINQNPANGEATRIVTGDQEAFYPMKIDLLTQNGMISAGTYYTFDAGHQSITGSMTAEPIHWNDPRGNNRTFESGGRILYGFGWTGTNNHDFRAVTTDSTSLQLDFFDTETLEDGSLIIDVSPHPLSGDFGVNKWWTFMASLGDYLFLQENDGIGSLFYRVDTRSAHPIIEKIYENSDETEAHGGSTVIVNGWAMNAPSEVPFVAYLMRPDGTLVEVNAAMLGFNPQALEFLDDQIVVTGMDGLTPRRFVIHPLATAEGELLVETPTESIPVKTLIPLQ